MGESFGQRLRRLRNNSGLSQMKLARLAGYADKCTINKWERGRHQPVGDKVFAVAEALNVDPLYLLRGDEAGPRLRCDRARLIRALDRLYLASRERLSAKEQAGGGALSEAVLAAERELHRVRKGPSGGASDQGAA